jgi:hypothetical protein
LKKNIDDLYIYIYIFEQNYRQWLTKLGEDNNLSKWEIFESKNRKLVGLGKGGKRLFRIVAQNLRALHIRNEYCGDLIRRLHIRMPGNVVYFPYLPLRGNTHSGIEKDVEHFRFLVGRLLLEHIGTNNDTNPLPVGFNLFFSKMFIHPVTNFSDLIEISFYKLHHIAYQKKNYFFCKLSLELVIG